MRTLRIAAETAKDLLTLFSLISMCSAMFIAALWWIFEPRIRPYLELIERTEMLEMQVRDLEHHRHKEPRRNLRLPPILQSLPR